MKIQCSDFDDLLMEGDALSMETAERHARECTTCAATLASWKDLSTTAQGLRTTWQNRMLWPRIDRALKQEQRSSRGWVWQVAAAVVMLVGLALIVWKATEMNKVDRVILNQGAVDQADKAQRDYEDAIKRLEAASNEKLADPSTPIMVSYKEKLMLLDDAIAECQTAIEHNRANAQVRRQLHAMYSEKKKTLQEVLREDTSVSHQ